MFFFTTTNKEHNRLFFITANSSTPPGSPPRHAAGATVLTPSFLLRILTYPCFTMSLKLEAMVGWERVGKRAAFSARQEADGFGVLGRSGESFELTFPVGPCGVQQEGEERRGEQRSRPTCSGVSYSARAGGVERCDPSGGERGGRYHSGC